MLSFFLSCEGQTLQPGHPIIQCPLRGCQNHLFISEQNLQEFCVAFTLEVCLINQHSSRNNSGSETLLFLTQAVNNDLSTQASNIKLNLCG